MINASFGMPGVELDPLVYLLRSGSDRVVAIDFQASATEYVPRAPAHAQLEQLMTTADKIDAGEPIDPDLASAILNGTPLGGARNHAACVLSDGLALTPAYDVSPQPRTDEVARRPRFGDGGTGNESRIAALADSAPTYHLTRDEGREIGEHQVDTIRRAWEEVCNAAHLTTAQREGLLRGPILNPYVFYE